MRKLTHTLSGTILLLAMFGLAGTAQAVPTIYTSQADWLAAVGGAPVISEDFESSPLGVLPIGTTDIGAFSITIDENTDNSDEITDSGFINGSREFHGDADEGQAVFDFSDFTGAPLVGFAGTWYSTTTGDLLTMIVNGTTFEFDNYLDTGSGFLGVVDLAGFSTVSLGRETISSMGEDFRLDNALLAQASVPEPTTLALLGMGLIGFGLARRK